MNNSDRYARLHVHKEKESEVVITVHNENLYNFREYKDRLLQKKDTDKPRRSVFRLLTSSLPLYILRYLILFLINAGLWVLLLQTGVLTEPEERVLIFSTSFDLIGFALAFIYWAWVRQGLERMFKKATIYESLLAQVESIARRAVQALPKAIDSEENRGVCIIIEQVELLLCAAIQSFTFVMLNDPINMKHPKSFDVCDLRLSEDMRKELKSYTPEDQIELSQYVIVMIEQRIKLLSDWKQLSTNSGALFNAAESISKDLRDIRTDREMQSYEYVNVFMISALIVVLFFFPYVIWPHARIYTLIVYPVLMFIITGLPLTIVWYGDPFEGTPGDNAIDYRYKEERSCDRVYESFTRYFKSSGCIGSDGGSDVKF